MTILSRETERYYHVEPLAICKRWRPVDPGRYGTVRLVCNLNRGHLEAQHITRDGWSWPTGRTGPFRGEDQPWRLWRCHGNDGNCAAKLIASYDQARVRGWKIWWRDGQLDPHCPTCARPDPVTVGLCRDLERSVRR